MKLASLQKQFSETTQLHGEAYISKKQFQAVCEYEDSFTAEVEIFHTELTVLGDSLGIYCECPPCTGKTCEHIWASLLIAEKEKWLNQVNSYPILTWHNPDENLYDEDEEKAFSEFFSTKLQEDEHNKITNFIDSIISPALSGSDQELTQLNLRDSLNHLKRMGNLTHYIDQGPSPEIQLQVDENGEMSLWNTKSLQAYNKDRDYHLLPEKQRHAVQWLDLNIQRVIDREVIEHAYHLPQSIFINDRGRFPLNIKDFSDAQAAFSIKKVLGQHLLEMKIYKNKTSIHLSEVITLSPDGFFADGTWYDYQLGDLWEVAFELYYRPMIIKKKDLQSMSQFLLNWPANVEVFINEEEQQKDLIVTCQSFVLSDTLSFYFKYSQAPGFQLQSGEGNSLQDLNYERKAIKETLEELQLQQLHAYNFSYSKYYQNEVRETLIELGWNEQDEVF